LSIIGTAQLELSVARNRCRLTQEGLQAIFEALDRLEIDRSNMSAMELASALNGRKIHRTTLGNMLNPSSECVQCGKIETLVDWINDELRERGKGELLLQDSYYEEVDTTKSTPKNRPNRVSRSSSASVGKVSRSQCFSDLLWTLNYYAQETEFCQSRDRLERAIAFLVRGKDLKIQQWLVKRLAQQIPNFENATKLELVFPRRPDIRSDFEQFWMEFSRQLKTPATPDAVLDQLGKLCREKPVILAMYGFRRLDAEKIDRLYQFWNRLVQQVCTQRSPALRSRLVLFLTDDGTEEIQNCPFEFVVSADINRPQCPVVLSPLQQIKRHEVRGWLKADKVYPEFVNQIGETQATWLIRDDLSRWSEDPWTVLEEICWAFQLERGIAEVEPYWKWQG
jgi:hypothetical protein